MVIRLPRRGRCSPSGPALAAPIPGDISSANATNSIVIATLISLLIIVEY